MSERRTGPELPAIGEPVAGVVDIQAARARAAIDPDAALTRLTGGGIFAEGPVWSPRLGGLLYSDIPGDRATLWRPGTGPTVWRQPTGKANGNTLDHEGRVLTCEHAGRRVSITELDGTRRTLVDRHEARRLNSPNDVVVKSDGTIWFTDPPYGILDDDHGVKAEQEQDGCFVFRYDPRDGSLAVVSEVFEHPNGLAFTPDEQRLYISDTSAAAGHGQRRHHILAFDVVDGVRLGEAELFAVMEPGVPDGFRVDVNGDVWSSAADGVHVLGLDGREIARIRTPELVANVCFGGPDGRQLFIAAETSLYVVDTRVVGAGVAAAVGRGEQPPRG